jgi:hypothetical protein
LALGVKGLVCADISSVDAKDTEGADEPASFFVGDLVVGM